MSYRAFGSSDTLNFVWLELTPRCNLECVHCYSDSGPTRPLQDGMTQADWLNALDEARALGCENVQFIGGEPTLYPGLADLIAHARSIGFADVCVYTNGTHFTPLLKAAFRQHRVSLAFSIYGSNAAVHDVITKRDGSFAKTCRNIRWALDAGLRANVGVISMEENSGDVERAQAMLRDLGVREMSVDRVRGVGRGAPVRPSATSLTELCGRCGNGKLCVGYTGEIFPCVFSRAWPVGHIQHGGLAHAYRGAAIDTFRTNAIAAAQAQGATQSDVMAAPQCTPEKPASPCRPEEPAPPCRPEEPAPPCRPEEPAPPCRPEEPVPPCRPEQPSHCVPEIASVPIDTRGARTPS